MSFCERENVKYLRFLIVPQITRQYFAVHLRSSQESSMATSKTATLTIMVDPNLKESLRIAAHAEHRSIANMIEVLIREHCEKNSIAMKQPQAPGQRGERS